MSRISSNVILDKLRNRLSEPGLPMIPCILGPFKVHHALWDWGATTNILPKMVYDCFDEDPLVPTSQRLQLADSTMVQPLRDSRECIDRVPRFFDLGSFHDHGYGSSLANLHHPGEALPEVSQSNH
jgi:hypothetical protein